MMNNLFRASFRFGTPILKKGVKFVGNRQHFFSRVFSKTTFFSSLAIGASSVYLLKSKKSSSFVFAEEATSNQQIVTPVQVNQEDFLQFKYVIVGAGTTAWSAFEELKKKDPTASIVIISEEPFEPYKRPPLSKELWNSEDPKVSENLKYKDFMGQEQNVFYHPEGTQGATLFLNSKVTDMDADRKAILLGDGRIIQYESILLATGGTPRILPGVPEDLQDKVSTFRNLRDFKKLDEISRKSQHILVIGGGFLGSEISCSLGRRSNQLANENKQEKKLKISQVFPECGMMCLNFPQYLSEYTTNKMRKELGLEILPGKLVKSVKKGENGKLKVELNDGSILNPDHIVVALGIRPNNDLAFAADLEIDPKNGGILVNSELQARSSIFSAGDVASFFEPSLGRRRVEHYDHAVNSGRHAAQNMIAELSNGKEKKKPYSYIPMFWSDLGSVGYEAIGLIDGSLKTVSVWEKPSADFDSSSANPEFKKGIVYYLNKENRVVGAITWGLFGKTDDVARIIKKGRSYTNDEELKNLVSLEEEHH